MGHFLHNKEVYYRVSLEQRETQYLAGVRVFSQEQMKEKSLDKLQMYLEGYIEKLLKEKMRMSEPKSA